MTRFRCEAYLTMAKFEMINRLHFCASESPSEREREKGGKRGWYKSIKGMKKEDVKRKRIKNECRKRRDKKVIKRDIAEID